MVTRKPRSIPSKMILCIYCKGSEGICTMCNSASMMDGELELQILLEELHPTKYQDYTNDYIWLFEHLGQEWMHDPRYLLIMDVITALQRLESMVAS